MRCYKILTKSQYETFILEGRFDGSPDDLRDGYIHLSLAQQVEGTLAKFFQGIDGLWLLAVDAGVLGDALAFEPSRGGELFPHLYGPLTAAAVIDARPIPLRDGAHVVPES